MIHLLDSNDGIKALLSLRKLFKAQSHRQTAQHGT